MDYKARLEKVQHRLPALNADAIVVANLTNVRYLCGYTGTAGMVVITPADSWFITDFRYQTQAAEQVGDTCRIVIADRGMWQAAAPLLKRAGAGRVAFEAEHTTVLQWHDIVKWLEPAQAVASARVVEDMRLYKDADEIAIIRRAATIIDNCFAHFCAIVKPGMRESEVAEAMAERMREQGAGGPSFDTIVASGARSALPHGVASAKEIESGDLVTLDMGALYRGYCSDFTRTVCIGKPTRQQQLVYETVWEAQAAAAAAYRPGLGCKAADAVARAVIDEAGFGAAFGHGLGHGVGMEIHEQPRLAKLAKGRLKAGMVVSCEPGIYLQGWGGVRIEELVLIVHDGREVLSHGKNPRRIISL